MKRRWEKYVLQANSTIYRLRIIMLKMYIFVSISRGLRSITHTRVTQAASQRQQTPTNTTIHEHKYADAGGFVLMSRGVESTCSDLFHPGVFSFPLQFWYSYSRQVLPLRP